VTRGLSFRQRVGRAGAPLHVRLAKERKRRLLEESKSHVTNRITAKKYL